MGPEHIDADELKLFLQEAEEQLQLLDEDIIRLEKEADNESLLQGIFRAAHTLKGSSGMLGLRTMAELTHVMEDTLDKVRSGVLAVSSELVDALLQCLDALKLMKEDLASGNDSSVDIAPIVEALRHVAQPEEGASGSPEEGAWGEGESVPSLQALDRARKAVEHGENVYALRIAIDEASGWAAVRCLQVVNELSGPAEIIWSSPSLQEIEQEQVRGTFHLLLITREDADAMRATVSRIDDLQHLEIEEWSHEGQTSADGANEPVNERQSEGQANAQTDRRLIDLGPQARGKEPREQLELAAQKVDALQTVRIDVDRLDALMNMVGELVIERTRVGQISRALRSRHREDELVEALAETCSHIEKVVGELNDGMMQVRMLPIGTLFNKFPRLVRDLARSLDKPVELSIVGADTEIDRSIIEKIKDPLVHMLRNAVDHGVEEATDREATGKPATATVELTAHHEQGHIVITLRDDGKGIDAEAVRESAIRKGVVTADSAERLSEAEALDLIFEPGFSTKQAATELSGRGVGMDVVKKSIGAINGLVKVDSTPGEGTTFTLQLPLTLATFRGLLVESGDAAYAIPLSYVQETGRLEPDTVEKIVDLEVVRLRGNVLPLVRLSTVCRPPSASRERSQEGFVVIVTVGEKAVAVAVDALREQQEIVVKSLGAFIGRTEGVAGASILGDGQVVLILDVASLVKVATQRSHYGSDQERRVS